MTGFDIDGVLTAGVKPVHPYVAISGRTMDEFDRTVKQIGTGGAIYLRPFGKFGDATAAGHWKATVIGLVGVTKFYEDDPTQAAIIRMRCPWCTVVMVVNGKPQE